MKYHSLEFIAYSALSVPSSSMFARKAPGFLPTGQLFQHLTSAEKSLERNNRGV
jgi:hypothetical protein